MARLVVLAAGDPLGAALVRAATARSHEVVVLVDRDMGVPDDEVLARTAEVRAVTTTDPDTLVPALRGGELAIGGVSGAPAAVLRRAAVTAGVPVVDADTSVPGVAAAIGSLDPPATAAAVPVVAGVGWRTSLGDLLAAAAASRLPRVAEAHVAYVVPDRGGVLAAAAPGGRVGLAAHLPAGVAAWARGAAVEELLGERRRLAWFPRPLGPHHAASAPGLEPLWVPTHLEVDTVRTYVAASSLRAELLQAAGNLSRWGPSAARVHRWLERPGVPVTERTRWACVAELGDGGAPARAWANGRDPHAVSVGLVVALAETLLGSRSIGGGVLAPARVGRARDTLDVLAAAGSLRWAVTDPARS